MLVRALRDRTGATVGFQAANRLAAFKKALRRAFTAAHGRRPTRAEWSREWKAAREHLRAHG